MLPVWLCLLALAGAAGAQDASTPPPVRREFRAAWVATVDNIDWPSRPGLSTFQQQAELLAILDRAAFIHLNAIILQVRPATDAFYESAIEPWSYYLTGRQGRPPQPKWDPLQFAVEAAHARGLELHAWFNPYRAHVSSDTSPVARNHVSRTQAARVRKYGSFLWMDPGDPATRRYAIRVVLDVVRRYDIDGVHIDDYFYPYRESANGREIPFPDDDTYRRYRSEGGTLERDDWRRNNVDLLVEQLYKEVKAEKRWVKFGVSPFGIWRPGNPESVRGLDSYVEIFADSRKWLREGWVDYFTPQLYWNIDRPQQRYPLLLQWWTEQNLKGRHLWPGNYTSRVASGSPAPNNWSAQEMINQVQATRDNAGAGGNVHFSMEVFMKPGARDSLAERLLATVYAEPAIVPASPWLAIARPAKPRVTLSADSTSNEATVQMNMPESDPRLWLVQVRTRGSWTTHILPGSEHRFALSNAESRADLVCVTAIDRIGQSSPIVSVTPQ